MKIAAIGDNCVDYYTDLNCYYMTGNAVDFAVNMQKLGIQTSIISSTGNDRYGQEMLLTLTAQGLDVSHLHVCQGQTAVSYMQLIDRERTYGDYVEGVMKDIEFSAEDINFAAKHDLVHSAFWGNAQEHLPDLHKRGVAISFDFATELNDPLVRQIAPVVDYAFFSYPNRDPQIELFMKDIVRQGATLCVVTFGEAGSLVWDGTDFHAFGIYPAEVVNTVGAGDSYIAGFIHRIMQGKSILEAQQAGARLAAQVVGTFAPWID